MGKKGQTMQDLVNQTGISRATLYRIKSAKSLRNYDFKMSTLVKLSKFFNTRVLDLIEG